MNFKSLKEGVNESNNFIGNIKHMIWRNNEYLKIEKLEIKLNIKSIIRINIQI
jgi:hypothetical protein